MRTRSFLFLIAIFVFVHSQLISETKKDSLKTYRLGEIVVFDEKIEKLNPSRLDKVEYYKLQRSDVFSFSELGIYLPSTKVRTNSRGESMLFIRGASERQLGLFFDGVQMNIPWDNRLDLTFVPNDIIGSVYIDKNASSILYGPNVLGGAVSISTLERASDGYGVSVKVQANDANSQNYSIRTDGKFGFFNYIANFSYLKSDGFLLSKDYPNAEYRDTSNQNLGSHLRTNSDQKRISGYLRGELQFDYSRIGLSVSITDQEKGVPAETYLGKKARFWRYPNRNRLITTLNGEHIFDEAKSLVLRGTFWYDAFKQEINSYKTFDYKDISEIQKDNDNTFGTRILFDYTPFEGHTFSYVFNGFMSDHKENINNGGDKKYSQITLSTGLNYKLIFNKLILSLGGVYDFNKTPKTGDSTKYENNSDSDIGACLSLRYKLTDYLSLFGEGSKRTRFPTLREAYSEALGKFKVNPNLKPESGILTEVGAVFEMEKIYLKLSGFGNFYNDLILEVRLSAQEDSLRRRIRKNLSEATIYGFELSGRWSPIQNLNLEGFFTFMHSEGKESDTTVPHIKYKPEYIAGFEINYGFDFGLKLALEADLTGKFYDADPDVSGKFIEIKPTTLLNGRISYKLPQFQLINSEIFLRVNNIMDTYRISQLGLPEPGRTFIFGISLDI